MVAGVEHICLVAGVWTARTGSAPAWETPTLVSGYTYNLTAPAANYMILLGGTAVLEPGTDYTVSGSQFTITANLVRSAIDSRALLRAIRMGSPISIPQGFLQDVPPTSAHPQNLEMGSTAGLTAWTPSGRYSLEVIPSGVSVRCNTAPPGVDWGGGWFNLPTGTSWSMFAKTGVAPGIPSPITDLRAVSWGIALLQNTTSTSQIITLASGWTGADSVNGRNAHIFASLWTDSTTFNTEYSAVYYGALDDMASYFRITRDGSVYNYWFSRDGVYWSPLFSHTPPWTPIAGAILYCNSANRAGIGSAGHFYNVRFTDSAAIDQAYPGRRL